MPDPSIRWMRDEGGNLRFYKHNHDLYSDELADDADEIIVLKAIVRIKTKTIVAIPVERGWINEPGGEDSTLGHLNEEARHAAEIREREFARPPRIVARPPGDKLPEGLPAQVITAGPDPDEQVLQAINNGALTIWTIMEATGLSRKLVHGALESLFRDKRITIGQLAPSRPYPEPPLPPGAG